MSRLPPRLLLYISLLLGLLCLSGCSSAAPVEMPEEEEIHGLVEPYYEDEALPTEKRFHLSPRVLEVLRNWEEHAKAHNMEKRRSRWGFWATALNKMGNKNSKAFLGRHRNIYNVYKRQEPPVLGLMDY